MTPIGVDRADAPDGTAQTMPRTSPDITATNRVFYNALWQKARLEPPDRFNTWPLVSELLPSSPALDSARSAPIPAARCASPPPHAASSA